MTSLSALIAQVQARTPQEMKKRVRGQLAMIRSSRDAGFDLEVVEYERNLADEYSALAAALKDALETLRATPCTCYTETTLAPADVWRDVECARCVFLERYKEETQ